MGLTRRRRECESCLKILALFAAPREISLRATTLSVHALPKGRMGLTRRRRECQSYLKILALFSAPRESHLRGTLDTRMTARPKELAWKAGGG